MKQATFFFLSFFFLQTLSAQNTALSPRIASYDIDLQLDTLTKQITANEVLYWKNPSSDTITELQFHLYYNAFRNNESTFMRDRNEFPSFLKNEEDLGAKWAWIEVQEIIDSSGNDLSQRMEFIQNDDGNEADRTVLRVSLDQPVMPYDSIRLDLKWQSKIPNIAPRTGYNKEYYFMVQWFPKVGVYEPAGTRGAELGRWNCHQYHASGEYYSDFGVYNVSITVPKGFKVGASGVLQSENEEGNTHTYTYRAEDVIDFAWTASPHFVIQEDEWNGIDIYLYTYEDHAYCGTRYFQTIKNAMEYLDEYLGPYPYETLTIVDPPIHGMFSGGMEYPTLISSVSFCFFPEGIRTPETLATHEFVHQYFMQMLATHEQEEPWMDEGMTTYWEGRILDHYDGKHTSTIDLGAFKSGNQEFNRWEFFSNDNIEIAESARMAREYIHGGYGAIAYNKTALWLKTLEGIVGLETMNEIMRTYFERWKFKHPGGQDFFDVVNEIVTKNHGNKFGENMDWFFEQVHFGSNECDYSVANIYNSPIQKSNGFFDDPSVYVKPSKEEVDEIDTYNSSVILNRLGEMYFPVDVRITFDDGESITEIWDGKDRSKEFSYQGKRKIVSAVIDPNKKIYIDKNFINNSLTLKPEKTGIHRVLAQFLTGLQQVMQTLTWFV